MPRGILVDTTYVCMYVQYKESKQSTCKAS